MPDGTKSATMPLFPTLTKKSYKYPDEQEYPDEQLVGILVSLHFVNNCGKEKEYPDEQE